MLDGVTYALAPGGGCPWGDTQILAELLPACELLLGAVGGGEVVEDLLVAQALGGLLGDFGGGRGRVGETGGPRGASIGVVDVPGVEYASTVDSTRGDGGAVGSGMIGDVDAADRRKMRAVDAVRGESTGDVGAIGSGMIGDFNAAGRRRM